MRYIFYADVYFIQNFMMKVAVIYLALYCNKVYETISKAKGIGKICLASFLGTITEIAGLICSGSYNFWVLCIHLFEVPLMIGFVTGKEKQNRMKIIVAGYFFLILINGVLEALWNQFGEGGSYLFFLIFSCATVIIGARIWRNYHQMQKGIFQVELSLQGKQIQTYGFLDSGNRLSDPYTGKGVHIISAKLWKRIAQTEIKPVYVPYQALGNENGMLEVYYVEELRIEGEKGRKIIQKCPVGVTKDNLFEGKKYEIILNEEVF